MLDRQISPTDIAFNLAWHPASGHPSGLWRVCRQDLRPGQSRHLQQVSNSKGRCILFHSFAAAEKRAKQMNAMELIEPTL